MRTLALVVLFFAIFAMGYGGYKDLKKHKEITSEHAWRDATTLSIISIFILLYTQK